MLKVLIAEGTEVFRIALGEQLAGAYVVRSCNQGKQALDMVRSFDPDILVLDLMLPELDGISLLQRLYEERALPVVLATTRFTNDYVLDAASRLGVDYVMVKPCDVQAAAARVRDLSRQRGEKPLARPNMDTVISNALLELSVPTKLRGYMFLREAVAAEIRNPGQLVTKELYPEVGKRCDATRDQVERSIRSAIVAAYEHRNEEVWQRYFPPEADGTLRRPSNGAFISALAQRLSRSEIDTGGKES